MVSDVSDLTRAECDLIGLRLRRIRVFGQLDGMSKSGYLEVRIDTSVSSVSMLFPLPGNRDHPHSL